MPILGADLVAVETKRSASKFQAIGRTVTLLALLSGISLSIGGSVTLLALLSRIGLSIGRSVALLVLLSRIDLCFSCV